ncbi:CAF17-like 4Fe-4S cluster assembly/insertion protein YgfZ [Gilvimarinus polysaccharolyticus]|uniref:CAF17-like 4Fe-4S cluster assembly/insertion protein YgfZ n=1 Tax=Gilvimarinus polysaccharolyticus TaxID=863921 RepID=UPI0006731AD2|nr:folate-binding protein YgfZ [Gilvimarinus polysaccharolyticus]
MNSWQDFLDTQGATRSATGELAFPTDEANGGHCVDTTYITELGYQGLLAFDGPDAIKFLQGQVTTDVRELASGQWKLGAQCNLKGRMQASFALLQTHPEQILLRCHASLTDTIAESLQKYAVFSKVKISNVSHTWRRLGVFGPAASKLLETHCNLQLEQCGDAQSHTDIIGLKLDEQRYELWVSAERAEDLWQTFVNSCTLGNSQLWQLADIRAGRAEITATNAGEFSPHELHYPLIGAVSFKKGCYTGQEVVARLHYKGKLKKQMVRIALSTERLDTHTAIVDAAGTRRGTLVMAAPVNTSSWEALAVLPNDDSIELYLAAHEGGSAVIKIDRLSLPYPLPTADNSL